MTRFVDETFQQTFLPTIGVDFKVRTLTIDDYQCKVQIWLVNKFSQIFQNIQYSRDTAGQERFRVITTTVNNTNCFSLIYFFSFF
jgi:GTPase SAR1 family protein